MHRLPYWRFLCGALAYACTTSPLGLFVDAFAHASAQAIERIASDVA